MGIGGSQTRLMDSWTWADMDMGDCRCRVTTSACVSIASLRLRGSGGCRGGRGLSTSLEEMAPPSFASDRPACDA
jgi:hypothetical protein